ncbi:alpha/beta hydrolase [Hymenobacter busanensis]|uniref:Alpha/beta hydrolase n=1 Tax=Hymenobacter busanensis TaxID=2607656 RepID=A0A7L4ZZQ0_9BACT|nr:alpha/beta hydrolase [Hymenobacter busanensis]KAA9333000.1 alpha/beta hydrolase [Hymenobacter busanensis]QHJ08326.1 alpha/beta fold hydrolase [Hymenobacter busanensis]
MLRNACSLTRSYTHLCLLILLMLTAQPLLAQRKATALANGTSTLVTTDGVKLYARVAGTGLPCLFVHGGPGSGSYGLEALGGKALEDKLQMVYLDQRGSGRSASDPKQNYSLDRMIQDLEEVREQLHVDKWVVMSHSFGGIIATAYAQKHPEHVQAMVLVNSILNLPGTMESTAAYGYSLLPEAGRPPLDPAAPLPQRWGMVMSLLGQQKLMGKLMYVTDTAAARASKVVRSMPLNQDFASAVYQQKVPEYLGDFTPASAKLTMPVLVLTGREDYVTGPEHYKTFRFPNQQAVVLPGKHYPFLENPKEFNQAVAGFVRKLPRKA